MADSEHKKSVAYAPFKTFLAAIEGFEHATMPHQIDTSVWPTYSGAIRSQLLGSLKFLGLIDDNGKPTPSLKSLVEDKANRKANLRKIIESSYPKVVGAGLLKMTPKSFDDLMREYGMGGSTHQKVTSFFLQAAKYAELPMSPLLGKKTRSAARKRKAGGEETNGNRVEQSSSQELAAGIASGTSKTVTLKSGGQLTLILSVNVFDLNSTDRGFVFGMIDKLQDYENGTETASK